MITSSSIFTLHAFGLTGGSQVRASFEFKQPNGNGRNTGTGEYEVGDDGQVVIAVRTSLITKGKAGTVTAWIRAADPDDFNSPPLISSDGTPAQVTEVPVP